MPLLLHKLTPNKYTVPIEQLPPVEHDCTIIGLVTVFEQFGVAENDAVMVLCVPLAGKRTPVKVYEPPLSDETATDGAGLVAVPAKLSVPVVGALVKLTVTLAV